MAMREDCRHFESRTYPGGEIARFCILDLAPEAPWRCPENCPQYERTLIGRAFVARLAVELMRPVPLEPLELRVRTIRPGRKVQWIEAMLFAKGEHEVARATMLRIRSDVVDTSGSVHPEVDAPPGPDAVENQK